MDRTALFTGTFDPFTTGHQNIVERALPLFDHIVIAVAVSKLKHTAEEIDRRVADIKVLYEGQERVSVEAYDDLTIDMAKRHNARFIIRGVRSVKDFEYERQQADINRQLGGVETVLFFAEPQYESVSSTLVRELRFFGKDTSAFEPKRRERQQDGNGDELPQQH